VQPELLLEEELLEELEESSHDGLYCKSMPSVLTHAGVPSKQPTEYSTLGQTTS